MLAICVALALLTPTAAPAADAKPAKVAPKPAAKAADKKKADEKQAEEDAKKAAELAAQQKAAADAAAAAAAAAQDAEKKAQAEAAARKAAEEQALAARGMDARVRALAGLLALPMKKLPGDYRDQRFAVLPFEDVGDDTKTRQLGLVVSDLLLTDLARDHNLPFVERAALAKVMSEQALGQSGAVAEAQAAQVGQLSGARAIVTGQVADVGASFHVTVRAIDTENATVLTAQEVDLPKEELIAFSAKSAVLKSKSGAFFRSVVAPGWGQLYNGEPVKAGVVGGATGLLLISTLATGATGLYTGYVAYPAAKKEDQPEQIRSLANTEIVVASVLGALTVTTWGIGALDAYLSGTDVESLDAALAKN